MFEASDAIEVYACLRGAGVASWVEGGWGVDALLGRQTREHADIDMVVQVRDVGRMEQALGKLGFHLVRGEAPKNFVLVDDRGREVDVHPVVFDRAGNGQYLMESGQTWAYPAEGFSGQGTILGTAVQCLSPAAQMLCHSGGYEPDEGDLADMLALHRRFGTPLPWIYREVPTDVP